VLAIFLLFEKILTMHISTQSLIYLATIFGLLVIPRALQRFRLPAPLTCFAFGIIVSLISKSVGQDRVMAVVATLGIASLFLLAGLEVDLIEIRKQLLRLMGHLGIRAIFLVAAAWLAIRYLHMPWQPAALLGLGLFTPSTGFILDTLPTSGLPLDEQTEVGISAIAGEITALLVLFFISHADSMPALGISTAVLVALIVLTPLVFLGLGKYVVPFAPGSEFSLLLMVGIICAVITQAIGVHVLIGAFVAGLVAGLLTKRLTTLASHENLNAVRLFASFFVPFYFFHEGLDVPSSALVWRALAYGVALAVVVIPIRIGKNWLECRYFSRRSAAGGLRVAVALSPTLIFTLVIAGMLHEDFHIDDALYGGLLVYAAISTILPSFILPRLAERTTVAMPASVEA
jgi:Kef-type K+ transport system membrane component KefB